MFRKLIRKFNDFRFTSIVGGIASIVAALYSIGSFFLYHFAGSFDPEDKKHLVRHVGFSNLANGPYLGMVLFFMAIFTLIAVIFVGYSLVPFIKNKEKLLPNKILILVLAISSIFELGLVVFMILLLAIGEPLTKAGIIATLPIGILSTIASGLMIIPFLQCDFYMPEIKK